MARHQTKAGWTITRCGLPEARYAIVRGPTRWILTDQAKAAEK